MDRWENESTSEIVVGRRRTHGTRRQPRRRSKFAVVALVLVVIVGLGGGGYLLLRRPAHNVAVTTTAIVAPGGFRAALGASNTITVGLEIRNTAETSVVVTDARIVAPSGVKIIALTLVPSGEGNSGFTLDGELPARQPITLGLQAPDNEAVLVARAKVDCSLLSAIAAAGEQIFVTIQIGGQVREEELIPPVVGDQQWLMATALRTCQDPIGTASAEPPLPPLPGGTPGPGASALH